MISNAESALKGELTQTFIDVRGKVTIDRGGEADIKKRCGVAVINDSEDDVDVFLSAEARAVIWGDEAKLRRDVWDDGDGDSGFTAEVLLVKGPGDEVVSPGFESIDIKSQVALFVGDRGVDNPGEVGAKQYPELLGDVEVIRDVDGE